MNAGYAFGKSSDDVEPGEKNGGRYRLTLDLSVEDGSRLWDAAAAKYRGGIGLSLAEVMETIGPREDPSIEDCLVTVALPEGVEGCALIDFNLTRMNDEEAPDRRAGQAAMSIQLRGYAPFRTPVPGSDPMAL